MTKEQFNPEEWQGRRYEQVQSDNETAGIAFIFIIILLAISALLSIF